MIELVNLSWGFTFLGVLAIYFVPANFKANIAAITVVANSIVTSWLAILALSGTIISFTFYGGEIFGDIIIRIDELSAWFILIINFTFITGVFYGSGYLKAYDNSAKKLTLHWILFVLFQLSMVWVCMIQNGFAFLIVWEIMTLSSFLSIIFEHEKVATVKAGINFLIQSHISILFLTIGFIWVASQTGSYDFSAIHSYSLAHSGALSLMLFLFFFIGFAIKAGFVPFHTWLPYAHPASPAHISGIMSGLLIKIGIFGILRMLLLIQVNYITVGSLILVMSIISGIYGVMLAILQHNLKKLLAYHSIENIGIIGIGIGLGCIGLGINNPVLSSLGFAGALLHTLNHSLFKSLLFFTAGNVYQATHTLDIEKLGGIVKKMPQTSILFLIAALAICGLPPFNGFISEFILYTGLYHWIQNAQMVSLIFIIFTVMGLAIIGGLALICFTKVFGVVFLGNPRHAFQHEIEEVPFSQLIPLYAIAAVIICIGLFPKPFLDVLIQPVRLFTNLKQFQFVSFQGNDIDALLSVSHASWYLIILILLLFGIRKWALHNRTVTVLPTWACGYTAPTTKLQYTASSFVKTYSKLFGMFFLISKREKEVQGIFPTDAHLETHPYDKVEKWLIDYPVTKLKSFMDKFLFIQNGKLQFYILYGILFIVAVISLPLIYEQIILFIEFFKKL
jgi:formate hydrogenlyase subunit 3/multisubunit Na+/H+ antiporter MnhD subunit